MISALYRRSGGMCIVLACMPVASVMVVDQRVGGWVGTTDSGGGGGNLFPILVARSQRCRRLRLRIIMMYYYIYSRCWLSGLPYAAVRRRRTLIHVENKTTVAISHQRAIRCARALALSSARHRACHVQAGGSVVAGYPGANVHTPRTTYLSIERCASYRVCASCTPSETHARLVPHVLLSFRRTATIRGGCGTACVFYYFYIAHAAATIVSIYNYHNNCVLHSIAVCVACTMSCRFRKKSRIRPEGKGGPCRIGFQRIRISVACYVVNRRSEFLATSYVRARFARCIHNWSIEYWLMPARVSMTHNGVRNSRVFLLVDWFGGNRSFSFS